jgi:hypothetical protein
MMLIEIICFFYLFIGFKIRFILIFNQNLLNISIVNQGVEFSVTSVVVVVVVVLAKTVAKNIIKYQYLTCSIVIFTCRNVRCSRR